MIKHITCKDCGAGFDGEHNTSYCKECAAKRKIESRKKHYAKRPKVIKRPVKSQVGNIMECNRKAQELGLTYGQYIKHIGGLML